MGELIQFPLPGSRELTPEERSHWHDVAAYWGVVQEEAADRREMALRMLGMLALPPDEPA